MKKIIISSGLVIAGILFFFYLSFLVYLSFRVIPPTISFSYKVKDYQVPLFILFFVIFVSLFVIYTFQLMKKKKIDTLLSKYDLLFFILYSLLFSALIYGFKMLLRSDLSLFVQVSAGLSLIFLTSLALRRIYNYLLKPILVNLFFKRAEFIEFLTRKVYWILDLPHFLRKSHLMLNQCKRFGLNVGIIGIYIKNLNELEKKFGVEGAKFIRKQFIFIITQNSREYEPWGRTPEKDLYINLMQLKFDFEMKYAAERFLELVRNYDFLVYNKKVQMDIRILAYSCDTRKFEWKVGEGEEETVKIIIENIIKKLKSQKKPLVISKDAVND